MTELKNKNKIPKEFRKGNKDVKHIWIGSQEDSVVQGNGEVYKISGGGNISNFNQIGIIREAGFFRRLIVNVTANNCGDISVSTVGLIKQSGGDVEDLNVIYSDSETGTKRNEQNILEVSKGEKIGIQIDAGEDSNGIAEISGVSWSVEFIPYQKQ